MTSPFLHPLDTVSTARANNYHRVVASPSIIQLARERLRRSFEETEAVNRIDSVMASRNRFQARTDGESVISGPESGHVTSLEKRTLRRGKQGN